MESYERGLENESRTSERALHQQEQGDVEAGRTNGVSGVHRRSPSDGNSPSDGLCACTKSNRNTHKRRPIYVIRTGPLLGVEQMWILRRKIILQRRVIEQGGTLVLQIFEQELKDSRFPSHLDGSVNGSINKPRKARPSPQLFKHVFALLCIQRSQKTTRTRSQLLIGWLACLQRVTCYWSKDGKWIPGNDHEHWHQGQLGDFYKEPRKKFGES